ncbi:hypothetical protein LZQ00_04075 [Sphingobacterium sp. SRCM116780]|uniref:DUF6624 domain-containing protein n=1 Tax=Sphingobacterium sp. SRCM116780 TaxID=2907623 RepID=UPI001F185890|nr:DUF6624 domain-containing protein [Sphingobacterium sp. SRCM116780]UIR56997.1 hypothetical protein LZQ00_04075 [Sphingobacterium sp. SRCM116780]
MKYLFLAIVCISITACKSQKLLNMELKKELDQILFDDQIYREFSDNETSEKRKDEIAQSLHLSRDSLQRNIWTFINKTDTENLKKVESIIAKYGYPGKSLVGEPTNTAVFYAIQHSNKIEQYYSLIEKAGKTGELPFKYTAMQLDRKLTNEGKPQIYGTQVGFRMIRNPKTGIQENFIYVLPIEDAKNVNRRRKKAGFDTTVEENTKRFGIEYKAYTYEELSQIK